MKRKRKDCNQKIYSWNIGIMEYWVRYIWELRVWEDWKNGMLGKVESETTCLEK